MMLHLRLPVHTLNIPHIYFYKVMQDSDALCLIQSLPPGVLYKSNTSNTCDHIPLLFC